MKNGWIMLHRQLQENPIYKNSKAVHCWIECLLRAHHDKKPFYLGRKKLILEQGEFILGRDEFGKSIGISGSTVWFWLKRFEVDNMLDIKKTPKGCLCKIKNWKKYQAVDSNVDNKKTANKPQINTDNNDKNVKKVLPPPKISKLLVDTLLEETGINAPDGDYKLNNLFPARLLAKKITETLTSEGKKEVNDDDILKGFKSILSRLDDFDKSKATSIKYINNNYYRILNSLKK